MDSSLTSSAPPKELERFIDQITDRQNIRRRMRRVITSWIKEEMIGSTHRDPHGKGHDVHYGNVGCQSP